MKSWVFVHSRAEAEKFSRDILQYSGQSRIREKRKGEDSVFVFSDERRQQCHQRHLPQQPKGKIQRQWCGDGKNFDSTVKSISLFAILVSIYDVFQRENEEEQ